MSTFPAGKCLNDTDRSVDALLARAQPFDSFDEMLSSSGFDFYELERQVTQITAFDNYFIVINYTISSSLNPTGSIQYSYNPDSGHPTAGNDGGANRQGTKNHRRYFF